MYLGDYAAGDTIDFKFTTRRFSTGATFSIGGSPVAEVAVYKSNDTAQSTSGLTLTTNFDSVNGLNHVRITTGSDGTFYANGGQFDVVLKQCTIDGVVVDGEVLARFTLRAQAALYPTVAGRTADVDASGGVEVGSFQAGAITPAAFAAGAIDAAAIADNAIDAGAIANDAITAAKIADGAIDAGALAAGAITNAKFAAGAIDAAAIADGAIDAGAIAADAITAAKIADGAIDAGAIAAGAITASKFAANAIDAAALAADAVAEIQSGLATAANQATIIGYIDTEIAAILAAVDTEIAAIKAKTDNLPAAPAATGDIPTAAQNATAVLTTAMTEAYAADGAAPTLAQALFMLLGSKYEFAIAGDTLTVKKLDGSTTAMTFTLAPAGGPYTSITRAS